MKHPRLVLRTREGAYTLLGPLEAEKLPLTLDVDMGNCDPRHFALTNLSPRMALYREMATKGDTV